MRSRRRAVLRFALGIALAAVVFAEILPRIASYGSVAHRLATVSTAWAVALAAATLLDILTTALPRQAVLPRLSFVGALAFTQASTALTTVLPGGAPLGMALSFAFLRRLRVSRGAAAFAVAVTGIWSQVMILVYPLSNPRLRHRRVVDLDRCDRRRERRVRRAHRRPGGRGAAQRGRAARWLGNVSARLATRVAGFFHRAPPNWSGEALARLRSERLVLLRRRWPRLTLATLGNQLTAFLVFELCLRAVGITFADLPLSEAFLGWAIGRVISSLPLTPGGIGVVELGMIGTLVGFGASNEHVVAAVLLYRGLIVLPTLVIGLVALPMLRRLAPGPVEPA